jgi:serine/threonine protein kinase
MSEQLLKKWKAISEIDMGHWNKAYLCEDGKGTPRVLWWPDLTKYEARFGIGPFSEGKKDAEAYNEIKAKCDEVKSQFRKKIEKIAGLSNQYVAEIYGLEHDAENNRDIAISEYCHGEQVFFSSRGMAMGQKISVLVRILRGLDFIHSNGLLHLNLKSENVHVEIVKMLVKITNWGFAVSLEDKSELKGRMIGTSAYMPYEVIFSHTEKIDERADLFSWAVLAYYILTGAYPFPDRSLAKNNTEKLKNIIEKEKEPSPLSNFGDNVPKTLEEIVLGMLKKDPDARPFKNATSLVETCKEKWPEACVEGPVDSGTIIHTKLTA